MEERPTSTRRPRKRWWLLAMLLVFGLVVCWAVFSRPGLPPHSILVLDVAGGVEERSPEGFFRLLSPSGPDMLELSRSLDVAAKDPRVEGLFLRVGAGAVGPGKVDELRALIRRFRASGKRVVAYASSPDTLGYFLATAADEILLDRSTTLDAVGLQMTAFFLKDALAKFGIEPDLLRVGDYKGAYEELAFSGPSQELEQSLGAFVDSLHNTVIEGVAEARRLDDLTVRQLLDRCPLPPDEALAEKLVDGVASESEASQQMRANAGASAVFVTMEEYVSATGGAQGAGRRVAVVHVLGTIVEGDSRSLPMVGSSTGADTVASALQEAAEEPSILGILLRIDSPGGAVSASEKIYHAVIEARKRKPLVASLGGSAASGGYYAACAAEKIYSHPTTLTGSIGVFGGKVVVAELLAQLRVEVRTYSRGKRAGMSDFTRRYSTEERLALKSLLEDSYRRFVDAVATGRKRSFEEIHAVAQGRIWTGRAALNAGLVDALGGIGDAISGLRELAHVDAGEPLDAVLYPRPATFWQSVSGSRGKKTALRAHLGEWGIDGSAEGLFRGAELFRQAGLLDGFSRLALQPFSLSVH